MKPLFEICLITKNEAKMLPHLFASLKEFKERGGRVNVCDTGSTDDTVQVARDWGCEVKEVGAKFVSEVSPEFAKMINDRFIVENELPVVQAGQKYFDFASARNESVEMATSDWICTVDADEQLTKLDIDKINEIISSDPELAHFEYNFVFSHDWQNRELIKFIQSKFYNRTRMQWVNIIHEMIAPTLGGKRYMLGEEIFKLEHWQNPETNRGQYLTGLAVDCFLHQEKDRNSHYFARELWWNGRPWSAAKEFKRHIAMNCWAAERAESMLFLGDIYGAMNHPEEQIAWFAKAIDTEPTRREPLLKLAQTYMRRNMPIPANFYATASLELPWNGFYGSNKRFYENEPHEILYWAKGWMGDIEGARKHLSICLGYDPYNEFYLRDTQFYFGKPKVSICIPTLGRPEKLKRLLEAIEKNAGYDNYEVIVEEDEPIPNNKGCPTVLKRAVDRSTGELVMFLGNDVVPEPNFVQEAVWEMIRSFPELDGMVGLADSYWKKDAVAPHWMASKKLLPYLGGEFFDTEFYHTGVDNLLLARCEKIGKYAYAERAKLFHDHPMMSGKREDMDIYYEQAYSGPRHEHDDKLYHEKMKQYGLDEKRFK